VSAAGLDAAGSRPTRAAPLHAYLNVFRRPRSSPHATRERRLRTAPSNKRGRRVHLSLEAATITARAPPVRAPRAKSAKSK